MSQFTVHGNIRAPARRIISLAPSITELLYYLGLGESVVGVTRQCDYPEAVKDVANIGSFLMPESKSLAELSPDIIVGLSDLHRHIPEIIDSGKTGIILLNYRSVQGVLDAMEALASLAGDAEKALHEAVRLEPQSPGWYLALSTLYKLAVANAKGLSGRLEHVKKLAEAGMGLPEGHPDMPPDYVTMITLDALDCDYEYARRMAERYAKDVLNLTKAAEFTRSAVDNLLDIQMADGA